MDFADTKMQRAVKIELLESQMLLKDKLSSYRLLLASHSPRRQELLRECGLEYELVDKYDVEEIYPADTPVKDVAGYLSKLKNHAYPDPLTEHDIVITADTTVIVGDEVLGKPIDRSEAIEMLQKLSGGAHTVITGVTIRSIAHEVQFSTQTNVWFRQLTLEEIEYYIDSYHPMDKAGGYGIQEWIGFIAIEKIEGSFYNVMGLPIQRVYVELNKFIE